MAPTTLFQTLVDEDAARLRVIAQQWDIPLTAERRTDQAAELADSMARADAIERMLLNLSKTQRAALDDILRQGGARPWAVYTRLWGQVRTLGPGKIEREALWQSPTSAAEALWLMGLVHRAYGDYESISTELAFVPEELQLYIPAPPDIPELSIPAAPTPKRIQCGADLLTDDLVTWWSALQLQHIEPQGKQAADSLLRSLHAPVEQRQALLKTLSIEQEWVRGTNDIQLKPNADPVLTWLQAGVWTQWQSLIEAWIQSQWDDLAHIPTLAPDPAQGWYHSPARSRRHLLEALATLKTSEWYRLNDVCTHIKHHHTFILRPDGNFDTWALRRADNLTPLRGYEHWDAIEGAYVQYCLTGPMHWLGMVDLGFVESSPTISHIHLTPEGAAVLNNGGAPEQPAPEPVTLNPQGQIMVPARRRFERFQLNRIATLFSRSEPYTYRFTPASLALARQQRISLKRILEFLEQASGTPVPGAMKDTLQQAYSMAYGAEIAVQWVLRVPDAEILKAPDLQPYIVEYLGETTALIRASDAGNLLDLLTEHGILTDLLE